jgi:DNA-binding PadR family transcriptional regulator
VRNSSIELFRVSDTTQTAKLKLWALAILALLRERPMHPYEMRRLMRERHKEERLLLKSGSLYHGISFLLSQGLITRLTTQRDGKRPERTVYQITKAGELELKQWLRQLLGHPVREASSFAIALDHAVHLAPHEVARTLEARVVQLLQRIEQTQAVLETLIPRIGRVNLWRWSLRLALARAELAWTQALVQDLLNGGLNWETERIWKLHGARHEQSRATRQ